MPDLNELRTDATRALRQMNNPDQPLRWRQIATDTEMETGLALVCTAEGADDLHPVFELETGTGRDEDGVYDCCPQPWIETGSVIVAAYLVALLNADTEGADVVTEYGITDGSGDKPEHLGDMTREQADAELAGQRRIWDELPLKLVQRTVTATAWAATETAGA